jgi:hypothetical protein
MRQVLDRKIPRSGVTTAWARGLPNGSTAGRVGHRPGAGRAFARRRCERHRHGLTAAAQARDVCGAGQMATGLHERAANLRHQSTVLRDF